MEMGCGKYLGQMTWISCESWGDGGSSVSVHSHPAQSKEKAESPTPPPRSEAFTSLLLKTTEYVVSSAKNEIVVKEGQEGEWWIKQRYGVSSQQSGCSEESRRKRQQEGSRWGKSPGEKDLNIFFWDWAEGSSRRGHEVVSVKPGTRKQWKGVLPFHEETKGSENIRGEGYLEDMLTEPHVLMKFRSTESRVLWWLMYFPGTWCVAKIGYRVLWSGKWIQKDNWPCCSGARIKSGNDLPAVEGGVKPL